MTAVLAFAVTLLRAVLISDRAHRSVLSTAVLFLLVGFIASDGMLILLSLQVSAWAQVHQPPGGPPLKPLVKLIGYVNAQPPQYPAHPPVTLALPGSEERVTLVLTDMQIMAGSLRTPGSIIDAVESYSINFYLRASPEAVEKIANNEPSI